MKSETARRAYFKHEFMKLLIMAILIALASCTPVKYGCPGNPTATKYNRP